MVKSLVRSKKLFSHLLRITSYILVAGGGHLRTEQIREEQHLEIGELTLQVGKTGTLQGKHYGRQSEEGV